ncbi:MAG: prephenate dehydrogenase/arogenate dehydrogenase family protein [SAR324 cluster bacterium]|nr:prephenate dehydrogenase/arogenate dehydrogenase family protein [SAR324 cluster bacterium]
MFDTVAVIGLGLIGGSFALDIKKLNLCKNVLGYDINPAHCSSAERLGIADRAFPEWNRQLSNAELVVVAVPVASMSQVIEQLYPWLSPQTILTDVGSVKNPVLTFMEQQNFEGIHFVAGHPISGSENFGPESARVGLFQNKKFIFTPTENTHLPSLEQLKKLWMALGSNVHEMTAELHDFIFSRVSHLPHLLAYAAIEAVGTGDTPEILGYFGAGLKDFSRIAASSPVMWADIFLENESHLLQGIENFQKILAKMEKAIREKDRSALIDYLAHSKKLRDDWITS